eukprot:Unigene188_Nuclearia_a/m.667 Unigene188_Nuclearia_a/g.667  ORF Unigene188_Nuclearia_a/g.667 Unigene188_Nuclearia_a/m.667 type:complete len:392 (+) Unigene188_Nuclearia_a:2280-3455(+)
MQFFLSLIGLCLPNCTITNGSDRPLSSRGVRSIARTMYSRTSASTGLLSGKLGQILWIMSLLLSMPDDARSCSRRDRRRRSPRRSSAPPAPLFFSAGVAAMETGLPLASYSVGSRPFASSTNTAKVALVLGPGLVVADRGVKLGPPVDHDLLVQLRVRVVARQLLEHLDGARAEALERLADAAHVDDHVVAQLLGGVHRRVALDNGARRRLSRAQVASRTRQVGVCTRRRAYRPHLDVTLRLRLGRRVGRRRARDERLRGLCLRLLSVGLGKRELTRALLCRLVRQVLVVLVLHGFWSLAERVEVAHVWRERLERGRADKRLAAKLAVVKDAQVERRRVHVLDRQVHVKVQLVEGKVGVLAVLLDDGRRLLHAAALKLDVRLAHRQQLHAR